MPHLIESFGFALLAAEPTRSVEPGKKAVFFDAWKAIWTLSVASERNVTDERPELWI